MVGVAGKSKGTEDSTNLFGAAAAGQVLRTLPWMQTWCCLGLGTVAAGTAVVAGTEEAVARHRKSTHHKC